ALSVERVVWGLDRAAPIVKGVSFELAAGELLGLIGPSGAGKSTLGRLLVGVLPPASGTVRLDGAELTAWEADALGAHIGYLPQDVKLFDATVAENVARLADPLEHSDAIVAAAKLAGAHDMILRLSQGYETRVGPDGQFLSSGQRQLVGFARALFGQPRLVVLDEPNANLDGDGEIGLIDALRRLKEAGVTVVCITHRPSVLRDATRILVLQSGVVAEFGSREAVFSKFARAPGPQPSIVRASAGTST
ncbi:MAG TPA: ATP-binding cassette domain-containing protein, partial [Burkholderiaceae bacterium]|nr:ATP-binding cassette domain-containing protein [Burkholderiaceae bacterium]